MNKVERAKLRVLFGGNCAYCGHKLEDGKWHADHVKPIVRKSKVVRDPATGTYKLKQTGECHRPENAVQANLYPACRACNIDKSSMSLESWRWSLAARPDICRRNHSAFRHAERFGLIVEVRKPVVFWFETYSKGRAK